jgi:hypothetical protein
VVRESTFLFKNKINKFLVIWKCSGHKRLYLFLQFLMVFSTTYSCEQGFSALVNITSKFKQRNKLDPNIDMRVCLSKSIKPRIVRIDQLRLLG